MRPSEDFSPQSEFFRIFVSVMPRIFQEAKSFEGLIEHQHGLRTPDGDWYSYHQAFKYPASLNPPNVATLAIWNDQTAMMQFAQHGKTHPPAIARMSHLIDRSQGPNMVMWWAEAGSEFSLEDGWQRLIYLRQNGPSEYAFSFRDKFASPAAA